jgi:murein DD-endopeptidase MepM/ murein hydrolase activator NlpD
MAPDRRDESPCRSPRLLFVGLALLLVSACAGPNVNVTIFGERQLKPTHRPTALPRPASGTYEVQKSDTVFSIARRYGISIRDVIDTNRLKPPYLLRVGQRLSLPAAQIHTVVAGDTVFDISLHYKVAMNELVRANGLPPPYTIFVGQKLTLPGGRGVSVASSQSKSSVVAKTSKQTAVIVTQKPQKRPASARPPARTSTNFAWPLGGRVISGCGFKGKGLRGAAVKAAENGIVAYSGNELRGFGNLLLIKHSDGFMSAYAHNEKLLVGRGDVVKRGQTVAEVGSSGNVTTPQLHFELRKGKRAVDPRKYLSEQTSQR